MRKFHPWMIALTLTACAFAPARAQNPAASAAPASPAAGKDAEVPTGGKELAPRLVALAQDTLRQKVVLPPHFRQAAAFIMAATQLDPKEPRYPRMLYEAMLQINDREGALKALKAYRDLVPHDEWAMANYIDLTADRLETAEKRLEYFRSLVDAEIPAPVRAHAAFRASQLARERGQEDLQDNLLGKSLEFNPLNLDALRARLDQLEDNGTPAERLANLLTMLKSNPVQPQVAYRIARELADAGLPDDALRNYALAVNLATMTGTPMGREFAMGYAAELTMMGQAQLMSVTKTIVEQLTKQDSGDVEALLLRWIAERGAGDKEGAAKTAAQVVNASLNRVLTLRQKLGDAAATTRPVDAPEPAVIPDLSDDAKKLADDKFADLRLPYTQAAADLAWYLVYVANQPAEAAKVVPALKVLLDEKDPVVVRTEGWIALAQGDNDQASMKLKAVADQDVIARMGTLLLWAKNPAEKAHATDAGQKLLTEYPAGLLGALLMDGMRDLEVKLAPRADAAPLKKLIDDFPKDFLRIVEAPQGFYLLKADLVDDKGMTRIVYPFGEPMIARVAIKNVSNFDLTIGPDGVIKNDLWFDANLRGLVQQAVAGAAYDRLGQKLVLKPGDVITQHVRLDQGQLATVLGTNPQPTLSFYGQVRTNPRGDGLAPCGQAVPFSSITERAGFNANDAQNLKIVANLAANGNPSEKIRSIDLVAGLLEGLRQQQQQNPNPQIQTLIGSFLDVLSRASGDPVAGVATWGAFLTAVHNPDKRQATYEKLVSSTRPSERLVGLFIANSLPPDQQIEMLTKRLEADKDPVIQMYAAAMLDIAKVAATQAANNPPAPAPTPNTAPDGTPVPAPKPVNPLEGIPLK